MSACAGLRLLEIAEGFGAAALCGQLFAGLGAGVVKIETGQGDPLRAALPSSPDGAAHAFHLANSGKSSVLLAAGAEGERDWNKLCAQADIILIDTAVARPGFIASPPDLAKLWPQKIICSIGAFASSSARANWIGDELIIEAMGGLMACTGYPDRPPVMAGVPYSQHVAAMFAFAGISAALWERDRSGAGQSLDLSSVECLITLLGNFMPGYFLSGRSPERIGNRHTIAAPWNLYPASDGEVVICTGTGGEAWWRIITTVIGREELSADERYNKETKRVQRVDEVDEIVGAWTRTQGMADIVALMNDAGIPASEIAPVSAVLADSHYVKTRAMLDFVRDDEGRGPLPVPGLPLKIGAWSPPPVAAPRLGQRRPVRIGANASRAVSGTSELCGALDGIRILEFGSRTSVPMAARLLGDLGAEIVKIEPPKGESLRNAGQQIGGSSYLFQINNAGKRSLVIDPKNPRGRELILELASKADVWMENLAPGTLDAMGLGFADMRAVNPRLVYCSVTGFGLISEHGRKKALDTVVQAACGLMSVTGHANHHPVKLGISAVDLAAAVGLVGSVIAALRSRNMSGTGSHVDLAMADVGAWITEAAWPSVLAGNEPPARLGNGSVSACPHNLFETRDGLLALAVETDAQWQALAALTGIGALAEPGLATASGRLARCDEVEDLVGKWLSNHSAGEVAKMLQTNGGPAAPLRSLAQIVDDPESSASGLIVEVEHPLAGRIRLLGNPLHLSRTPPRVSRPAPLLGEHSRAVLTEWLDMPAAGIDTLQAAGVIAGQPKT